MSAGVPSYDDVVRELFARQPNRMVPDLDRIRTLTELLGRPDQAFPAIQVTGTNGKTTVSLMISALLGALGLSAGTYTSPHLQDVRERIRVAGEPISREEMVEGLAYLAPFVLETDDRHPEALTFFEILTALSFTHFGDKPVDVGVYEVGMGGAWDATNLVRGEVAVLNSVSLDHLELGSTLQAIAREKAGVIKDGAVVVSAAQDDDVADVIAAAAEAHDARLVVAGRDFDILERGLAVGGQYLTLRGVTGEVDEIYLPLHGAHQARNAAVALAAVEGFLGFAGGLDAEVIREGFAAVRSPGRVEVVRRRDAAPVVLDGAHNPAGAATLAQTLRTEFGHRHRVFVLGVLGDKDVEGIVEALLPVADHLVVTEPPSGRAAPTDRIAKALHAAGRTFETAADVPAAIELASGVATEEDAVVVTGSLYMVGAARDALGLEPA
ncbi:MAG TPA: Mur ligase family protein [Egibacteraceae bacterium]|nr:Mur ligase family protein [Egibacteraceae bacterium]